MLSAFLNPWTFLAGAALVSTPIIIHLINRIRFRRVKWAAMEFLLKAQKKMRRKKILEQLLLLFLRCMLVFLIGVLFARFIGGCGANKGKEARPTTHLVILDDTPSMADAVLREDGQKSDAYTEAKRLVYERIMPAAAEATTAQTLHVLRLSELDKPYPEGTKVVDGKTRDRSADEIRDEARVNGAYITRMEEFLRPKQVSTVHRSLAEGLRKGKELLALRAGDNTVQVLHVVSDLRAADWAADGPAVADVLKELKDAGVTVHLIDVANPARKPDRKSPPFNDNVGIVGLTPRSRVVSINQPTLLEVRVKNFGGTDLRDVPLSFYINGQGNVISSARIDHLPANQERSVSTVVRANELTQDEKTKLGPLGRFRLITATLGNPEPGGLAIDNARHVVIEVRETLKVLVVDGRTLEGGTDYRTIPAGDSWFLRTFLTTQKESDEEYLGRIVIENGDFTKLATTDLRPYSAVYLMNVPTLNENAVKNLERYVGGGGGVGVFLGPNVKPDDYNKLMHKGGTGFFPVPLQPEFSKELTPDQKFLRGLVLNPRLMLRDPALRTHSAIRGVYTDARDQLSRDNKVEQQFRLPIFDHYWPVNRGGNWRDDKAVQELYCLPNETPIGEFEPRAVDLVAEIKKRYNEPKFEKARKYLDPLLDKIRKTPADTKPLSELARLLDELLCDQVSIGDESEPVLREFWQQPEMAETRNQATRLRDATKYGDPLYVVKQFGRGRVAVMMTDASGTHTGKKQWNDWASGQGATGWTILVAQMQKYLAGGGEDMNRSVGDRFFAEFDVSRFEPTATAHLLTTGDPSKPSGDRKLPLDLKPLGKLVMDAPAHPSGTPADAPPRPYQLGYSDTTAPGAYLFTLTRKKEAGGPVEAAPGGVTPDPLGDQDYVGAAFNVDALAEGDLRRANTDDLATQTNKVPLHNTEDLAWIDEFKQKPSDLSSGRWLYLLLMLVLIAEQMWAVRISYHTKPEDLEELAPSAAAAFAHHTTLAPASPGEPAEVPARIG